MHIRIQPDFSLAETARIAGEALDVSLKLDDSGYFEEFPAFSGVARDTSFALLGPPEPKYIVGTPYQHYELQLHVLAGDGEQNTSLAVEMQKRIAADGRLRSELL